MLSDKSEVPKTKVFEAVSVYDVELASIIRYYSEREKRVTAYKLVALLPHGTQSYSLSRTEPHQPQVLPAAFVYLKTGRAT